ncbi:MAG TPA: ABC transporter substrate-binding protein [Usitatibacter sp.]|jgi:ABC-type branched-subunit amino acid transport system substrate-binding protein|nr:ABC transporter substrate-binding protein [Usitatibacter sp.]
MNNKSMKAIARFLLGVAASCAVLGSMAAGAGARDIVVGQVVDYAGKYGEASRDFVAGARVYFDSLNAAGGLNGHRIVHVVLDGGSDGTAVRARTRELLADKKADVLFGYVGEAAVAAAAREPLLSAGGVALVAPLAARETPDVPSSSVFYMRPGYQAEVREIVEHFRPLQVSRFVVVLSHSGSDAWIGQLLARQLAEAHAAPAGVHVLSNDSGGDDRDVEAVRALQGQAVIVATDTVPAAQFIKRFRPREPGTMVIGLSLTNHRVMFEMLGPALAHGVMITQVVSNPALAESAVAKEHLVAMRTYRDEPPSHLTLEGFLAAKALVEGMRRAGPAPGRESIVAAFRRIGRLDLGGVFADFTPEGRMRSPYVDIAMIRRDGSLLR